MICNFETAEPQKIVTTWAEVLSHRLKSTVCEVGWKNAVVHGCLRLIVFAWSQAGSSTHYLTIFETCGLFMFLHVHLTLVLLFFKLVLWQNNTWPGRETDVICYWWTISCERKYPLSWWLCPFCLVCGSLFNTIVMTVTRHGHVLCQTYC